MSRAGNIITTRRGTRAEFSHLVNALLKLGPVHQDGHAAHVIVETQMDCESRPAVAIPCDRMSPGHKRILAHIVGHFLPVSEAVSDCFADLGAVRIIYMPPSAVGGHEALEASIDIETFLKETIGLDPAEAAEEMAS